MIIDNTPRQEPVKQTLFGSTPPATATIGDLFFKTTNRTLAVFNGTEWVTLADEKQLTNFKKQVDGIMSALENVKTDIVKSTITAAGNLQKHVDDASKHVSSDMLNLLSGVNGISSLDINRLVGTNNYFVATDKQNIPQAFKSIEATKLGLDGGKMSGDIDMSSNSIKGLTPPVRSDDAATKQYVDSSMTGIKWLSCVEVATTKNIGLQGVDKIDGEIPRNGRRVLVKNQDDHEQNGIYIASYGEWTRVPEFSTADSLNGHAVTVRLGQTQKNTTWLFADGNIVELAFAITPPQPVEAGDGLLISSNKVDLNLSPQLTISDGQLNLAPLNSIENGATISVGSSTQIPIISIDQYGRVVAAAMTRTDAFQPANIVLSKIVNAEAGLLVKDADNSIARRSIDAVGNGISVINSAGVEGNPTIKLSAVSTNTTDSIVFRDSNGDFAANVIHANLQGTASNAVMAETAKSVNWKDVVDSPYALSQFKNDMQLVTASELSAVVASIKTSLEEINKKIQEMKPSFQ